MYNLNRIMETSPSPLTTLSNQLHTRQKHILFLQSQLLRLDYQYGHIIKQLKQKYTALSHNYANVHQTIKQFKKNNKKLQIEIINKDEEVRQMKVELEEVRGREKGRERERGNVEEYRRQEVEGYCREVRELEGRMQRMKQKLQQTNSKKQQYKQQVIQKQQQLKNLQKQITKLQSRNKQLQTLVQQQLQQTQHRIQTITNQYITNHNKQQQGSNMDMTIKIANMNTTLYNTNSDDNTKTNINTNTNGNGNGHGNSNDVVSDWQSDMRKLKNCVDYGSGYLLVFDAMNLDRNISRQIFQFLKKQSTKLTTLQHQLISTKHHTSQQLQSHKQTLQHLQHQLSTLTLTHTPKLTIDTQSQTQTINTHDLHKTIAHINQVCMKMRIRNSGLVRVIQMMAVREVVMEGIIGNKEQCVKEWRKMYRSEVKVEAGKSKLKPIQRLRACILSIIFIQSTHKKTTKHPHSQPHPSKQPLHRKIRQQTLKHMKSNITNIQLQKLKQSQPLLDETQIYNKIQDIVGYLMFKINR